MGQRLVRQAELRHRLLEAIYQRLHLELHPQLSVLQQVHPLEHWAVDLVALARQHRQISPVYFQHPQVRPRLLSVGLDSCQRRATHLLVDSPDLEQQRQQPQHLVALAPAKRQHLAVALLDQVKLPKFHSQKIY